MTLSILFRRRLDRGFSLLSFGPNEFRIVYDAGLGMGMLLVAWVFVWSVLGYGAAWQHLLLPFALLSGNTLAGVYSRLKTASIREKVVALFISLTSVCALGVWIMPCRPVVILWGVLVAGPLVLARIFLGLPYSKHGGIARIAIRQRGPVLVVGGAGYIGSHVVEQLLADGQKVRVLDRLLYGEQSISDFRADPKFEMLVGDATDIGKLTTAMEGVSAVIHLAGLVGDPACAVDPVFTRHTNIIATRMVREVALSLGVYRFIFASSCSVYGANDREVSETDHLNPVSLYAQTKIDSEREILHSVHDDFFATILRFATVFGHSRRPRFDLVANMFVAQALSSGEIHVVGPQQWRPFIHVKDLARAVMLTLKAPAPVVQSQIYNVGDQRLNLTILQLAAAVQEVLKPDREVRIHVSENAQDHRNYRVSFEKIHRHLGFEAHTFLNEGLREMADHFKRGDYGNYKESLYSNLAMTEKALAEFRDPLNAANLYAPISQADNMR